MKVMTISKYFEIVKPKYAYLKLTPDKSIRNYNSTNIAKSIHHMYTKINQRISFEERKLMIKTNLKCSYMLEILKDEVNFYFIVPMQYENIVQEKIREIWPKIKIDKVEGIKPFSIDSLKYQLNYKKEDAFSLNVDKRNNEPLSYIFSVIDIMKEDDRLCIIYNFIPCSQFSWKKEYEKSITKMKNRMPVDKEKFDKMYIFKIVVITVLEAVESILRGLKDFLGINEQKNNITFLEAAMDALNNKFEVSSSTKKKKELSIIKTQIGISSESADLSRRENNALAVAQSYKSIEEDNELIYKKVKQKHTWYLEDFKLAGVDQNKISIEECQNFLQLPGRTLLEQYDINHINTLETEVPKELREGCKLAGISTYRGNSQNVYYTMDKDYKNLALVFIGPTRSGKTTALSNYSRDSINANESLILLDYIENCSLSEDVKKYIPKEKIIEIDLGQFKELQGFGYNELDRESDNPLEFYNNTKLKANQLGYLINSINSDDSELKARMERYLDSAAVVVFISKGPVRDVFSVLQDHKFRKKYIDLVPYEQKERLEEYISSLEELDEWSKATKDFPAEIIGTRLSFIQGILNRVNKLKKNTVLELMLKKDIKDNINLVEEIQKGKAIFIKMPEDKFGTPEERDIITTYWITKVWLALQIRASKIERYDRTTVNIITDELNQLDAAQSFVGLKLDQIAKFGGKFVISTMYINQLKIREKLRNANTSYVLISGADKTNYTELKEELSQFGFALEDLFNLKRFYALNYIKYENGYWGGISKLPPPIK